MSSQDWVSEAEAMEEWGGYEEDDFGDVEDINAIRIPPPPDRSKEHMIHLYGLAQAAKLHATIQCPSCKKTHVKTTYHKVFCSNGKTKGRGNCKDTYWNKVNPARAARQKRFTEAMRKRK